MIKLFIIILTIISYLNASSLFGSDIKLLEYLENEFDLIQPDLTCFVCDKSMSNEDCNRKAIDESCSQTKDKKQHSCLTVHQFNSHSLETVYIEKKCIQNCTPELVGCESSINKKHQHIRTCSYCCSKSYCNLESVVNVEQAFNKTDIITFMNNASSIKIFNFLYFTLFSYIVFII